MEISKFGEFVCGYWAYKKGYLYNTARFSLGVKRESDGIMYSSKRSLVWGISFANLGPVPPPK